MWMIKVTAMTALLLMLVSGSVIIRAQQQPPAPPTASRRGSTTAAGTESRITGVYRIDVGSSDKLYSVVAGASSNLPFGEQQRFFMDLAVRLTPPDMLVIERRGRAISIASSRAPRINFDADGVTRTARAADGHIIRTRAMLEGEQLRVNTAAAATTDSTSPLSRLIRGVVCASFAASTPNSSINRWSFKASIKRFPKWRSGALIWSRGPRRPIRPPPLRRLLNRHRRDLKTIKRTFFAQP
jgi:hypothetical protein